MMIINFDSTDMCDNDGLFWYQTAPQTNTDCNPQGQAVTLQCIVYVPHVMGPTSSTLKWFQSDTINSTEKLLTRGSSKYSFVNSISTVPEPTSSSSGINTTGLYQDIYAVIIRNFSTSDNGYYWCQLESVTNSSCLIFPRSPQGYIAVDLLATRNCLHSDYLQQLQPPQCALPQNICQTTHSTSSSTTNRPIAESNHSSPSAVVGTLSFLIILLSITLLITVTVFAVAWIKLKKKYKREVGKSKSVNYRYPAYY